ncbi:splicing factor SF2 [Toxoplasma gondii GAB2-2007-GAL-DOM2]|uniref:Splicing factor SF2 n=9 Tax=Toxoplasma gondii TaxID=5811 RepID=A0A125YG80_TOXGV|nr:splicing factor SF2 [Toxoplasma gondii GT1]ESS29807.1 splicing factor SF2 [Toxoplasma gondii VEG]KAF4644943.1 splicing factor SF2 [Toxoplasma gondii]KFG31121.1 splicing factor SF2 [Toxoplasma gondii GAB2-2007-GAL-DOM2]KFG43817.1 splicing factor SF2 [Toxoplasma gondii FOU]KFH11459.1 splicing factor SF2 [Toxoplasma gondii MAS]RQX67635.1 splicing factor SF2 [Toxoplasma gondii CAST]
MSRHSPSPRRRRSPSPRQGSRIFVANLPLDVTENELEDLFYKFGRIEDIEMRRDRTNDSTIAFVQFAEYKAADDAIEGRDGAHLGFHRIRIERSRQRLRRPGEFRRDRGGYGGRESGGNGPAYGPPRRSEFRVRVYGLPPTASWQDLKDHMRRAGDVGYANIEGGVGVVEYSNGDDMDYALRKLHGSVFRNIFHTAKIRVERDLGDDYVPSRRRPSLGRERDRSRHRSRSPRGGRRGSRSPVEYSSPERRREEAERERRRCARDEEEARHTRRSRSASSRHGRRREEAYSDHEERREKSLDGDRFEETERGKPREREDGRRPRSVSRSSQESRGERDGLAKDEREKGETRRDDERERRRSRSPSDYRGRGQKRDREDEREDDRRRVRGDDFSEETRRNGLERDERGERDERDERDDREGVRRSFERDREETRRGRRDEEREEARHSGDEE